jgi:hypothetical protein
VRLDVIDLLIGRGGAAEAGIGLEGERLDLRDLVGRHLPNDKPIHATATHLHNLLPPNDGTIRDATEAEAAHLGDSELSVGVKDPLVQGSRLKLLLHLLFVLLLLLRLLQDGGLAHLMGITSK